MSAALGWRPVAGDGSVVAGAAWAVCAAVLLVSGPSEAGAAGRLRVATFRCDVTPPHGHPLCGGLTAPLSTVEDPLWAKGIVLDDGAARYVLCAVDWCGISNSTHDLFRRKVAAGASTDASRVAVQCVHQHTAPVADGDAQKLLEKAEKPPLHLDMKFLEDVTERLAAAAKEALARLQPFDRVGTGQAKVDRVASTRRIPLGNGKVRARMSSCRDAKLRAMTEGTIDPFVKTITLARGNTPLVRLHYYATHPQSFYGDGRACSDVPGFARERLEKKEGVFQIYFNGCGGNVAMGKYNDASRRARGELAERLFAGMAASVASTRFAPVGEIRWRTAKLLLPLRTDGRYAAERLRAVVTNPKASGRARIQAALYLAFAERSQRPIELSALWLGHVRILHLPGEPFVEFQLYAQRLRPDGFVAVAGYGDTGPWYICTERAFAEGGYEPTDTMAAPPSEAVLNAAIRTLLGVQKVEPDP